MTKKIIQTDKNFTKILKILNEREFNLTSLVLQNSAFTDDYDVDEFDDPDLVAFVVKHCSGLKSLVVYDFWYDVVLDYSRTTLKIDFEASLFMHVFTQIYLCLEQDNVSQLMHSKLKNNMNEYGIYENNKESLDVIFSATQVQIFHFGLDIR